jgi:hypothetical protein
MIVGEGGKPSRRERQIVRLRTLLETVREARYSPNMCSPIAPSAHMIAAGGAAD